MRTVWRVFAYLRRYPWMALGTLGCAVLSTLMVIVFPVVTKRVIDEVLYQHRAERLTPLVLIAALAFVVQNGLNSLRIILNNTFEQRVIFDLRSDLYSHIQMLPLRWFDNRATGDLMTRILEDVTSVERMLIDGIEQGVVAVLQLFVVLAMMFYVSVPLSLIGLAPLPVLAGGALWYTLTAHRRYRTQRQAASAMNALLMDNLQGVRQIKAFGREPHEDSRFAQRADDLRKGTLEVMLAWANYSPAMSFVTALGTVFVLWYSGSQMLAGKMTLGQLVGFLFYLALFYEPIARLHGLNQMLQAARAAGERVFDILDAPAERDDKVLPASRWQDVVARAANALAADEVSSAGKMPAAPWRAPGEVIYENIGFSYSPE